MDGWVDGVGNSEREGLGEKDRAGEGPAEKAGGREVSRGAFQKGFWRRGSSHDVSCRVLCYVACDTFWPVFLAS